MPRGTALLAVHEKCMSDLFFLHCMQVYDCKRRYLISVRLILRTDPGFTIGVVSYSSEISIGIFEKCRRRGGCG